MGFRFRRSVKILPGVRLNFTARGVSATVGPRGASVNFGRRGVYANLGLPGTGLSYRERLDGPAARGAPAGKSATPAPGDPARARRPLEAVELSAPQHLLRDASGDEVARLIPLWPWVTLLVGGFAVALATGAGAGLVVGLLAALVGSAGAAGVPAHRAELRSYLREHRMGE